MSVLITGGRIITAADDIVGDILIEDGRIALIGRSLRQRAEVVVEGGELAVAPGFGRCIERARFGERLEP